MDFVELSKSQNVATVKLNRPKVNALNEVVVKELTDVFCSFLRDSSVGAVVLTGEGSFFSFGFDVPGFMNHSKEDFHNYVTMFSELIKDIFMFEKPVIAAINGHAIAGGAVLSLSCDYRIMVSGKSKIALNEMTLGSTLFTSVVEMLRYAVGSKSAEHVFYTGSMYSAEQALAMGLVDECASGEEFEQAVSKVALDFAAKDAEAFKRVKGLLKRGTLEKIEREERYTIAEFVDVWYSPNTKEKLKKVEIRS